MKDALEANPYVPVLLRHPALMYVKSGSFPSGSPARVLIFVKEHGVDWLSSMVGWLFFGAFVGQAEILIRKDRRAMRDTYRDLCQRDLFCNTFLQRPRP